ncbi:MAG TPA: iron-sulfur cluster repair di-iron protein [Terriglobales bacterium]|nr:iron-sulfur cluster repair di-iron protein [Terriglobales bacterium]
MPFTAETKVSDIALSGSQNRQVLEQAKVDFCCGGGQSLHQACAHSGVTAGEILSRLRENAACVVPGEENWQAAPLAEITRHIREKHHRYVRQAVPRVYALLEKVIAAHGANHTELAPIAVLFQEVGREMIQHMQKEEQILFPYIDALERAADENAPIEPPFFQSVRNPIAAMMKEHDAAGALVKQIRGLSGGYLVPEDVCASYAALYKELKEFEADLHEHVHLENNVLFPRAVELESAAA